MCPYAGTCILGFIQTMKHFETVCFKRFYTNKAVVVAENRRIKVVIPNNNFLFFLICCMFAHVSVNLCTHFPSIT